MHTSINRKNIKELVRKELAHHKQRVIKKKKQKDKKNVRQICDSQLNIVERHTRHKIPPEEEFWQSVFCATRHEVHHLLLENLESISYLLKPAVLAALQTRKFCQHLSQSNMVAITKKKHRSSVKLLIKLAQDPDVQAAYIYYDLIEKKINQGHSHPGVLFSYAKILDIEIGIWQLAEDGCLKLYFHSKKKHLSSFLVNLLLRGNNCFEKIEVHHPKPRWVSWNDCLLQVTTEAQAEVTDEKAIYIKEKTRKIFMQFYSMLMSDHPAILFISPEILTSSIFRLMLDPIRYQEKLQQYASKLLFVLSTHSWFQSTHKVKHAAPSIWKLCLLLNSTDCHGKFHRLFSKASRLIKLQNNLSDNNQIDLDQDLQHDELRHKINTNLKRLQVINSSYMTVSGLQSEVTEKLAKIITDNAARDMKIEYSIGPYRVDLAFPSYQLVIEIDGNNYHYKHNGQRYRDEMKDRLLLEFGWRVIRIPQYEYLPNNTEELFGSYMRYKLKDYLFLFSGDNKHYIQSKLGTYDTARCSNKTVYGFFDKRENLYAENFIEEDFNNAITDYPESQKPSKIIVYNDVSKTALMPLIKPLYRCK